MAAQQGEMSDVFKLLPLLKERRGDKIQGIQERVRAAIEKRFGPGVEAQKRAIDKQVEQISQYLAALQVDPEDLDQPKKISKGEKAELVRAIRENRVAELETIAKGRARLNARAARAAPSQAREAAAAQLSADNEEDGINDEDTPDGESDPRPSKLKLFSRILDSSMQFLDCDDLTDWVCLEKTPAMTPKAEFRRETVAWGTPVNAGPSLDMEWYFNEHYDDQAGRRGVNSALPPALQAHIRSAATPNPSRWDFRASLQTAPANLPAFIPKNAVTRTLLDPKFNSIDFALYGIDDVLPPKPNAGPDEPKGSMREVFNALVSYKAAGKLARGVVDVTLAPTQKNGAPWLFSYLKPAGSLASWFFGPAEDGTPNFNGATFQYTGTAELMNQLNNWSEGQRITKEEEAKVRVEWSPNNIMHNKFIVFRQGGRPASVWTGTANFSAHCMGEETNSNISLLIKNPVVATAFASEFEHMFQFFPGQFRTAKIASKTGVLPIGRFHHNKVPASARLFTFGDGTMLRVHFAPTDDGEHRAVLPMIHSANRGDTLTISMFGNSGFEYIRSLQLAVARGVNVRMVLDRQQAAGNFSWLKDPSANLLEENPYMEPLCSKGIMPGKLEIKTSDWSGKNHYKAGTLTRANGIVEAMIVGSQNWSNGGNDGNDENMISIQNKRVGLAIGRQFNLEFEHLADASRLRRVAPLPAVCRSR